MNKSELINEIAKAAGISRTAATRSVETVLDTIVREVARGGKVSLTGFGTCLLYTSPSPRD